jgi:ribosomal protein RSM22 (predicted rRNA methylase)
MSKHFTREDLVRLKHLRSVLLSIEERIPGTPAPRYWGFDQDLALYDRTFAERIGWKWRAVLGELSRRGFVAPDSGVLDYGCGTGVAAREWLASDVGAVHLGARARVRLWDRDSGARAFAKARVSHDHPKAKVDELVRAPSPRDLEGQLLLVSHVLDELVEGQVDELIALARHAAAVVWVEPGSRITSRRLSEARDRLLDDFGVVAPCTHSERCGALRLDPERSWCHFFGEPAPEAFTEGHWAEFGRELGIDLRSLPYSFIALARKGAEAAVTVALGPVAPGTVRLLGRPRLQRGRALLDTCQADGVREEVLLQRIDKALFKALDREHVDTLVVERDGDTIVAARRA